MSKLQLHDLNKIYPNGFQAVYDFNLEIEEGEFIVLVGPSGCGKSTTLRMIAGLEDITSGDFFINGKVANNLTPKERGVAMVFQSYALYPHLNVFDNLAFGLDLQGLDEDIIEEKVHHIAEVLGLSEYLDRKPRELSGGQRQRVAVGRAIIRKVDIFLMDEPLSNLDAKLRVQMRIEISKLHQKLQTTFIYVTHDQTEAMTLGTRIVVMKDGLIQQVDTPQNLYDKPQNLFVAGFMGSPQMNFIDAVVMRKGDDVYVEFNNNSLKLPENKAKKVIEGGYEEKTVILGIRPEDIHDEEMFISNYPDAVIEATVRVYELLGAEVFLYFTIDDVLDITARVNPRTTARPDDVLKIAFDMSKLHIFDKDTEQVITN